MLSKLRFSYDLFEAKTGSHRVISDMIAAVYNEKQISENNSYNFAEIMYS